ncbi:hypothetical protein C823_007475 [Eubacterium plexicaudatum ASF492]|nr:hypothetical protein C823_007475 [Eubacterium plexicaudatum ASF492]
MRKNIIQFQKGDPCCLESGQYKYAEEEVYMHFLKCVDVNLGTMSHQLLNYGFRI